MDAEAEDGGARRILFAAESGWGHVNPLISVAAELAAHGAADLWFACCDEYRGAIEAADRERPPEFVSLGPTNAGIDPGNWTDEQMARVTTPSPLRNLAAVIDQSLDFEERHRLYLRMLDVIDEVRPALAVVDLYAYSAIDALMMRGIPYVALCPGLPSSVYPDRLPWSYPTPLSGLRRELSRSDKLRNAAFRVGRTFVGFRPSQLRGNVAFYRARVAEGHRNPESKLTRYADDALAVFCYSAPGFEYPFADMPENVRMIGTMLGPRTESAVVDGDLGEWLEAHESVVYVCFGTVMRQTEQQIRAIVDAAERLGPDHHVLWKLPKTRHHLLPKTLPANLRVESWLPSQLDVLAHPHVRAFFNHGGANGVHEGIYFGKPQLVLPFWMDNVDTAARICDSGSGLALDRRQSADGRVIADLLGRVLNEPAFRVHASGWQGRMREAGGSAVAADWITASLESGTGAALSETAA